MDGLGFIDGRKRLRVDIDGEAFWSCAQVEGSGRILSLCAGGVGIADADPLLPVGTKVQVTLAIGDERIASIPAEVVWAREERLGVHFRALSLELQGRIDALVHELAETTDGRRDEID